MVNREVASHFCRQMKFAEGIVTSLFPFSFSTAPLFPKKISNFSLIEFLRANAKNKHKVMRGRSVVNRIFLLLRGILNIFSLFKFLGAKELHIHCENSVVAKAFRLLELPLGASMSRIGCFYFCKVRRTGAMSVLVLVFR